MLNRLPAIGTTAKVLGAASSVGSGEYLRNSGIVGDNAAGYMLRDIIKDPAAFDEDATIWDDAKTLASVKTEYIDSRKLPFYRALWSLRNPDKKSLIFPNNEEAFGGGLPTRLLRDGSDALAWKIPGFAAPGITQSGLATWRLANDRVMLKSVATSKQPNALRNFVATQAHPSFMDRLLLPASSLAADEMVNQLPVEHGEYQKFMASLPQQAQDRIKGKNYYDLNNAKFDIKNWFKRMGNRIAPAMSAVGNNMSSFGSY